MIDPQTQRLHRLSHAKRKEQSTDPIAMTAAAVEPSSMAAAVDPSVEAALAARPSPVIRTEFWRDFYLGVFTRERSVVSIQVAVPAPVSRGGGRCTAYVCSGSNATFDTEVLL